MTSDLPPPISSRSLADVARADGTYAPPRHPLIEKMIPGQPLISFRDISIGFEDREVLQSISFDVQPGETKVLLGESGTGKTLLMKMATGLIRPDSGTVMVMGQDVTAMSEHDLLNFRREIGFVFQEGALFDSMTVAENVSYRLHEENADEEEIEARVRESLRFVEMEQAIDRYPAELSGGMRRRVSIARALADRPPIVFYDSPTAGLDPVTSQTIITLILRGRDLQDVTSLLATHRVQDAFGLANYRFDQATGRVMPLVSDAAAGKSNGHSTLAQREQLAASGVEKNPEHPTTILILRDGKIYLQAPADEVLHSSDSYIRQFLASAE
ncbi:MAG TPA: ATP-binding cassette domain-containing protein [Candidatus Acidoferrales bacterium]